MKLILPFLLFILVSCSSETKKINFSGDLEIGIEHAGVLEKKISKSYVIHVDSSSYITGYVDQKTVDVVVKLFNEQNEEIANFDGPDRGKELFSFSIKKMGKYRLEIEPFKEEHGDYTILIDKVEPIATNPDHRVDQLLSFYSHDAPGAVIAVIDHGKIVFLKAYGKSNLTHDLDFKLNTPTNIGSVSKQFTAFAILLLEQQGELSLDDDVRKHIPELPDFNEEIKIKNLLNHTNGLREIYNLMPITGWDGEDKLLRQEVLNTIIRQKELQASPNEEFNYNNSAFIMLAEIVERKSNKDFPVWMKENVFEPLEMYDTYVRRDPTEIIPGASQGYSQGDFGFVESGDLYAAYGAGGIYTTPSDLTKWLNNFNDTKLGTKDMIEKMITPDILNNGDTLTYGLGIGVGKYKGLERYAHGGADIAHRAMMTYFPEINSGVITLSNNASFSRNIANEIADIYFSDDLIAKEIKDIASETNPEKFELSSEIMEKYTGKFSASSIGMTIEYKMEEGKLVAHPTGQSSLILEATSETSFKYKKIDATVVFKTDEEGNSTEAVYTQGGKDYELKKLPPYDPSIEQLQAYTGKFYSEELETFYTIKLKDSGLIAEHRNLKDIKFSPIEEGKFNGDVYFIREVVFEKDKNGLVESLSISNGRTKGMKFEKQ